MSRMPQRTLAALLLTSCALTTGCAAIFLQNITDIRLESLAIVDLDDHPELHPERSNSPRPTHLAQLRSTTTRDLVAFAPKNRYIAVSVKTSQCDEDRVDEKRLVDVSLVYNRSGIVDYLGDRPIADPPGPADRYEYYGFVYPVCYGNGSVNGYTRSAYDLRQTPTDLCFVIAGDSILGAYYTSNIIRMPAGVLRQAMARANLPPPAKPTMPQP